MRFTILTPTYNRARHLGEAYRSLCAQTFHDFEWVIVDDGSTDGTPELVSTWKPFFPIRYIWKPNGGKHTAVNIGVEKAAGEFIAILDSDDRCVANALERLDYRWRQIPDPDRFANLVCLCCHEDGSVLGSPLPEDHMDVFTIWDCIALSDADRWGIVRADILKKFRYPEFKNERFVLEGLVWNRIHKRYGTRFFNEPLRIAGYAAGGLTSEGDLRHSSPKGAVIYHSELAFSNAPIKIRLKSALNAARFSVVAAFREMRLLLEK